MFINTNEEQYFRHKNIVVAQESLFKYVKIESLIKISPNGKNGGIDGVSYEDWKDGYYKLLWSKYKKLFSEKKIASFWVTNGTVKIKLLNDQVRSITHEVDLSALTHEGPLVGTDRNE